MRDHKKKYGATNPLVRFLIKRFLTCIANQVSAAEVTRLIDLGCGEGDVAGFLIRKQVIHPSSYIGMDISTLSVSEAQAELPGFDFNHGDFFECSLLIEKGDLVCPLGTLF